MFVDSPSGALREKAHKYYREIVQYLRELNLHKICDCERRIPLQLLWVASFPRSAACCADDLNEFNGNIFRCSCEPFWGKIRFLLNRLLVLVWRVNVCVKFPLETFWGEVPLLRCSPIDKLIHEQCFVVVSMHQFSCQSRNTRKRRRKELKMSSLISFKVLAFRQRKGLGHL